MGSQDRTGPLTPTMTGSEPLAGARGAGLHTRGSLDEAASPLTFRSPHSDSPFRQGSSRRQGRPPRSDTWASPQVSQVEPVRPEGELWRIRAQAGLSVVAILAVDVFFHFFYILTIPSDLKFVNRLPDSALGGCAPGPAQGRGLGSHLRTDLCAPTAAESQPWQRLWKGGGAGLCSLKCVGLGGRLAL